MAEAFTPVRPEMKGEKLICNGTSKNFVGKKCLVGNSALPKPKPLFLAWVQCRYCLGNEGKEDLARFKKLQNLLYFYLQRHKDLSEGEYI